jgi:hypothetical protein
VGGYKERINEGEYGGCILYSYMKIEKCSKKGEAGRELWRVCI